MAKLSTLFSRELLPFIFVSRHFWFHHPNKAYLFLKGLSAKKLNLVIVILSRFEKNIFLVYCSKFSDKKGCYSKQFYNICGELPNWNKFFIWIVKYWRTASSLPFKFMISSGILPSSSLTLPWLSVRRIECCIKKKPSADKYSHGLFTE